MNYRQINESVMHVPNALRIPVLEIVASTMCGILYEYAKVIGNPERNKEFELLINTLQQKFGAKIVSLEQLKTLEDKSINIAVNAQNFINELQNMKLTEEQEARLRDMLYRPIMLIMNRSSSNTKGVYTRYGATNNNDHKGSVINIAVFGQDIRNPKAWMQQILSVLDHELQHFMQYNVLSVINSTDKQFDDVKASDDARNDYMTSSIEFSPHVKNIISRFESEVMILKVQGELKVKNTSEFIKSTIENILKDSEQELEFISRIKKSSEQQFRKIWQTVYNKCTKFMSTITSDMDDAVLYSIADMDSTEISANINVMKSIMDMIKSNSHKVTAHGRDISSITDLSTKIDDCAIIIKRINSNFYQVKGHYKHYQADCSVDADKVLKLCSSLFLLQYHDKEPSDILGSIGQYGDPRNLEADDLGDIQEMFDESASMFGSAPALSSIDGSVLKCTVSGVEMKVEINNGSVELSCDEPVFFFMFAGRNAIQFFQFILRSMNTDKDKTLEVLQSSFTIYEAMFGMAEVLDL